MPDAVSTLHQAVRGEAVLRAKLIEQFGEAITEDEQCLLDTLEGISDLTPAVDAALQAMADAEMMADAISTRIGHLKERANALLGRSQRIKRALLWAMLEAGRQRLTCAEATVSVTKGRQSVEIINPDALPADFLRTKKPEPNKEAIAEAIKAGREVSGARLVDGPATLTIRK